MSIADNLQRVQERIARAAESVGRKPDEITLVGVTKYVDDAAAAELAAAGCHHLGESRPQELWKKHDAFQRAAGFTPAAPPIHWHLIGHLQRNKVARTLPLVTLIHSVDSERLLATINEARAADTASNHRVAVLLEVNTSGDAGKDGLAPHAVASLIETASSYPHVAIGGLMTMAALEGGDTVAARNFVALRELRDRLKTNAPPYVALDELSMGMSNDFEVAIREGATIVRVGSLLWTNDNQSTSYNDNQEFNAYIARNMWSYLTRSESWALMLAMKRVKLDSYPLQLEKELEDAPADVVDASNLGYDALLTLYRERFRAAQYPIARCPKCNRILRTPQAKMCIWCGCAWHAEQSS